MTSDQNLETKKIKIYVIHPDDHEDCASEKVIKPLHEDEQKRFLCKSNGTICPGRSIIAAPLEDIFKCDKVVAVFPPKCNSAYFKWLVELSLCKQFENDSLDVKLVCFVCENKIEELDLSRFTIYPKVINFKADENYLQDSKDALLAAGRNGYGFFEVPDLPRRRFVERPKDEHEIIKLLKSCNPVVGICGFCGIAKA